MDLSRLQDLVQRHQLNTPALAAVLEVSAHVGELAREMLRSTRYGQEQEHAHHEEAVARLRFEIGDLMFAVAYLCTLYDLDPEVVLWESVERFESRLEPRP